MLVKLPGFFFSGYKHIASSTTIVIPMDQVFLYYFLVFFYNESLIC